MRRLYDISGMLILLLFLCCQCHSSAFVQDGIGQIPPNVFLWPQNQSVPDEGTVSFFCTSTSQVQLQIVWFKNGKQISGPRYTVAEMPGGSVLRIEPVRMRRDEAKYECVLQSGAGYIHRVETFLTVIDNNNLPSAFPQITVNPQAKVVETGRNAIIPCAATGSPRPTITWLKDMVPVNKNNLRYSILEQGSLQITDSQKEDEGKYECVAANMYGTVYSQVGSLYVSVRRIPPHFSIPPENAYVVVPGSSLNVMCVAVGSPMPFVKWRKGAKELTSEDQLPVGKNILIIDNIQESANYTCVASSNLGQVEFTTQVTVNSLSQLPTNLYYSELTATSVKLTWSYDTIASYYFTIQYKPKLSQEFNEISGIPTMHYTMEDLSPNTEYEFYVFADTSFGHKVNSSIVLTTLTETNTDPPSDLHIFGLNATSVSLSWSRGYPVSYYVIQYKPKLSNKELSMISGIKTMYYTITGLIPNTEYEFYVTAVNHIGRGTISITGETTDLSAPSNVIVRLLSSSTMMIQWDKPEEPMEHATGYNVYYSTDSNQPLANWNYQLVSGSFLTTINDLQPQAIYTIQVQKHTCIGRVSDLSLAVQVKIQQGVPMQPTHLRSLKHSPTSFQVTWRCPENSVPIISYELYWNNTFTKEHHHHSIFNTESYILTALLPNTLHYVWVAAKSRRGEGPATPPIPFITGKFIPEDPRNVRVSILNLTTLRVKWNKLERVETGIILGYHIHIQEVNEQGDSVNEPIRYDVADNSTEELNITNIQPDTTYTVQVSAYTHKGSGKKSHAITVSTPGGVPLRPQLSVRLSQEEPFVTVDAEWTQPVQTNELLQGYRVRYGKKGGPYQEVELDKDIHYQTLKHLEKGSTYEVRVASKNHIGYGKEIIELVKIPAGVPTGSPLNTRYGFQTPTTVAFTWDPPLAHLSNGEIVMYQINFHKITDHEVVLEHNVTTAQIVLSSLDENSEYIFRVKAFTTKGGGPYNNPTLVQTSNNSTPAPTMIKGLAMSLSSIYICWMPVSQKAEIIGYRVFYTLTPVEEDMRQWQFKDVPLTNSVELHGLEPNTTYAIRVTTRTATTVGHLSEITLIRVLPDKVPTCLHASMTSTHSTTLFWKHPSNVNPVKYTISYDATKEYIDSQGRSQNQAIPVQAKTIDAQLNSFTISDLMPFTTYRINLTTVPPDYGFYPSVKITVTTAMAAPQPMVKPDVCASLSGNGKRTISVILPIASEEFGPISHYFLVAVPEEKATKSPDHYTLDELETKPFHIAARFLHHSMPYLFELGAGVDWYNSSLKRENQYRVFVRAIVDTPQSDLYTSSPYSDSLYLNMTFPSCETEDDDAGSWNR